MRDIYAVLDIGGATIKLLVGEIVNSSVCVLFAKKITSHGIKKGLIDDMSSVVSEIKTLLDEGSRCLNAKITHVALCVPSMHARIYQSQGMITVKSPLNQITHDDIIRVLNVSKKFERRDSEEIISVIPVSYQLDTKVVYEVPLGKKSASLKVETLVITTQKNVLYTYMKAVEKAGVDILDVSIDCYACAKEAFDAVYLKEGAVLIDIGYKSSTISFFEDGYLKYIAQAHVGGYDLTKTLANAWQIPMDKAEVYKVKYGTCDLNVGDEDVIHTSSIGDEEVNYTQKHLAQIMSEGVEEIMRTIKTKIDVIDSGRTYETLIVGGGGELPDIDKVAGKILGCAVRKYRPDTIGVRDMSYVSTLGMIHYIHDRSKLLGQMDSSLILPDISSTMSLRFKGLTKAKPLKAEHKSKFSKVIENLFQEDNE